MNTTSKLGFGGLVALVFGLMVGVGIFNLPQNMAATSSVGAVTLAWLITAVGMLTLVAAFKILSTKYPYYNAGIYQYALAGYGQYVGFNASWGYWLSTAISNVAYAVMLNDACGAFFPTLLHHDWHTIAFGSLLIWIMYFIVERGVKTAKIINTSLAVVKVVLLIYIIVIFCIHVDIKFLTSDIWGNPSVIGNVGHQIKESMMVTLFCFFGIEGAVMLSARAKRPQDVGKAGIVGFIISLLLFLMVSVLCFGIMTRTKLSGLEDPSVAYILKDELGSWAYYFVIISIIIALLGGWVAWTLVVAQVPYEAANVGILPKLFSRTNSHKMPATGLFASSVVMELFLIMVVAADNVYLVALHITGLMILPCYLFTALFLWKQATDTKIKLLGIISTAFCCWMIYAGGIVNMALTSFFYLAGLWFFYKARKERRERVFTGNDKAVLIILCIIGILGLILYFINA